MTVETPGGARPSADPVAGDPAAAAARALRSNRSELLAMLPDVVRLLRGLAVDPQVPRHAKVVALAAAGYALIPPHRRASRVPGTGLAVGGLVAVLMAVRHLIAAAGYELVHDRWTGTDAGFGLLIVLAGVNR